MVIENERKHNLKMQYDHESAIVDKKIAALDRLANSLNKLSSIRQPTVVCVSIDKDTNPKDLKELIESLR
jgi:hypothetical protein